MGKLKKVGISFVVIIGIFVALVIAGNVWLANMTPEERQQWEEERAEDERQEMFERIAQKEKEAELEKQKEELEKQKENEKLDTEEEVLNFIKNYKGEDNSGPTLFDTLDVLLAAAYPNEDIVNNPSTTGYFIASPDYSRELSDRYWKVEFKLQTYKDDVYWVWLVDTETNTVYPGNGGGKEILVIMDTFDK